MNSGDLALTPGTSRWYDRWARYLSLLAVFATLLTTVIVFFTTGQELGGLGVITTASIGLLGLVISLQIETIFRIAERSEARERYGRMLELVEDYPDLQPLLTDALEASVTTLKHTRIDEFKREVLNILVHADVRLRELSQGRLRVDDGDNSLVLARFQEAKEMLCATTDEGDTEWWRGESGVRFFELNKELMRKGASVERVWLLGDKPNDATKKLIDEHHSAGVQVFVMRSDRAGLDKTLLVNMTMMDEVFLQEDLPNKLGQAVEYLYSENRSDLERARSRFARLKSIAAEYTGREVLDELAQAGGKPAKSGRSSRSKKKA
ncbi:MAG TPA: hypothetical protein VLL27_14255 [Solirubrobacterales bacterium]|nr:hypothetical protein [Solirubrobacterales bacterium]